MTTISGASMMKTMDDLKLTTTEARMLDMFRAVEGADWLPLRALTEHARMSIDMLVLSGLVERKKITHAVRYGTVWLNEWRLTPPGRALIVATCQEIT